MSREIRKNYWTTKLSAGCKYKDRLFPYENEDYVDIKIIYCCDDRFSK